MMRNFFIVLALVAGTVCLTYGIDTLSRPSVQIIEIPGDSAIRAQEAPNFTVTDIAGHDISLHDFKGRTVVLNFWASWCVPCVKEFPLLMDVARAYPDSLHVIALSSDFKAEDVQSFLDRKAPGAKDMDNFTVALDDKSKITADLFQTFRLPETIIIDENGLMRDKLVGANWSMEDMSAIVAKISSEIPAGGE